MKTDTTAIAQTDTLSPAVQQPAVLSATQLSTATENVADTALLSHFIDNVNNGLTTHEALAQAQLTVNTIATAEHAVTIATPQQSVQMQQDNALATGENINALLPEDSTHANTFIAALNAALAEDTEPELAFATAQSTLQHTEALHITLQTPLAEKAQLLSSLATDSAANNQLIPNTSDTSDSSNSSGSDADIFSYHLLDELSHGQSIDTAFTDAQHVKQVLAQAQNTSVIPISDADAFISNLSNPANIDTQIEHLAFTSSQSEALQSAFTNDQPPYEAVAAANSASTLITSVETSLTVPSDPLLTALASGEHVTETIAAIVPDATSIAASQAQASPQEVEASLNVAFDKAVTLADAVKEAEATSNATDKVLLEIQTAVADSPDKALIQALASGENISTALSSVINLTEQKTNGDNAVNTQLFAETLSNALAQGSNINTAILNAQTEARQQTRAEHAVQLPQQDKNTGLLLALATGNALNEQALKTEVLNALSEQIQQRPGDVSLEQALTLAQQHINMVMATLTDINVPQATSTILGLLSGNERIGELIQTLSINPELLMLLESIPQTTTFEAMQELISHALASGLSVNAPLERAALALNEAKASSINTLLPSPEHLTSPTAKLATLINPTAAIEHSPSLINILSLLNTLHQLFENIQIKDAVSLLLTKQENALQDLAELYTLFETKINTIEALLKLNVIAEQQFNLLQQAINLNRNVTHSLLFLNAIPLRAEEAGGGANASPGINPSGNFFIDLGISPTGIKLVIPDQLVQPFIVLTGAYGQLTLYLNGAYVYELANTNPSIEALTPATYLIDTFESKLINPFRDTAVIKLSIIIKGANDAPVAVNDTGVATEAGGVSNQSLGANATGNVLSNDSDSDANDTKTVTAGVFVGQLGSLELNADGSYVYVIDNSKATVDALKTSTDTLSDTFTYTVTDTAGLTSSATLTLTLQGANDAPLAVNDTGVATEAGGVSNQSLGVNATGNVLSNDSDSDANDTKSLSAASIGTFTGNYGSLTLNTDGSYVYVIDNSKATVDALKTSTDTLSDTFTYTVTDTAGLTSSATLTLTLQGANDAPLAVNDTGVATEAGGVSNQSLGVNATGNVLSNDSDSDANDTKSLSAASIGTFTGNYGSLTLNTDGSYVYVIDNSKATVNALKTSTDTLSDTFTYTVTDSAGLTSSATLTLTLQGANDAPVAVNDTGVGTEAGGVSNQSLGANATGNVLSNDSDSDANDTKTVMAGVFVGQLGSLELNADGSYVYVIDNTNATVEALNTSTDTLSDTFTYTVTDSAGLTSSATLTLTLQGANDAPVAVNDTGVGTEAGGVSNQSLGANATGNVLSNDSDSDANDTKTVTAGVFVGQFGSLELNADGSYVYVIDNTNTTVNALNASTDKLSDTFSYTLQDAAGLNSSATLTLTLQGANDAPVAVNDTDVATEAGGVSNQTVGTNATGNVLSNDFDSDANDTKTVTAGVFAGQFGSLTLNTDGSYEYVIDNTKATVDALKTSTDTLNDTFTYTVTDAAGLTSTASLSLSIQGANDVPLAVNDTGVATEAGGVSNQTVGTNATGNVLSNDSDSDVNDTKTVTAGVFVGQLGSLELNADGSYLYVIDNSKAIVNALKTSTDTLSDTFTYTLTDTAGLTSSATLTLTLQGANDAPVAVNDTGVATEAGGISNQSLGLNATGNVLSNDSDSDANDTKTVTAGVFAGQFGSLELNADGSYVYVIDNSKATVDALNANTDTLSDAFTYTLHDAAGLTSSATLTLTLQGANDAPVAVNDTGVATEAGGVSNQSLGANATGNVLSNDSDSDVNDTKTVTAGVFVGQFGSLELNADGSYVYVIDNTNATVNALKTRTDTLSDTFTYTLTDAAGLTSSASLSLSIQGANDAPVAVNDTGVATEAGGVSNQTVGANATGNVLSNDFDSDGNDTKTVTAGVFAGQFGSLTLNADGSYVYVIDNTNTTVNALKTSTDTLSDAFSYTLQDAAGLTSSATLTLTLQGANDAPVAVNDTDVATEAGGVSNQSLGLNATGNVLSNDSDSDANDTKSLSAASIGTFTGNYGSLTLNTDGSYVYVIDNSKATVDALNTSTDTLSDTFAYTVTDAAGLTSSATLTLTLQGANDAPVAINDTGVGTEAGGISNQSLGANATGNVLSNDSDSDANDTKSLSAASIGTFTGNYGSLTLNTDGSYVYVIDNSKATVDALNTSTDTLSDTFAYTVTDTAGLTSSATLTLTLQGANDAPVAVNDTGVAIEAGGVSNQSLGANATGNVLSNDTDTDANDIKTVTAGVFAGQFGSLTLNADGSYVYIIDNTNTTVNALNTSTDTLSDAFTYTVTDAAGLTSSATLTLTLQGANDAPVAINDTGVAIEAGGVSNQSLGANATGNVLSNDSDSDANNTKSLSAASIGTFTGNYGSLTLNTDGSYVYVIDNSNATVNALKTSTDTLSDTFTYTLTDTAGLTSSATLTLTLQGANDAPLAVNDTGVATEAGGISNQSLGANATGNVLSNDSDNDANDTKTVTAGVFVGQFGSLELNADGSYVYVIDNSKAIVNALNASTDTLSDTFFYTVTDAAGLTSSATLTLTLQGANDAPVAVNDTGVATEAGGVSNQSLGANATGNVLSNDSDSDVNDTKTVTAGVFVGQFGSLELNADGSYVYVIDNTNATVNALKTRTDTLSDTFTYTLTDAAGLTSSASLSLSIQGANDAPVAVNDTGVATEAGGVSNQTVGANATGNVLSNDFDSDGNDTKTVTAGVFAGQFGSLTLNADGSYVYVIDNTNTTVNALKTSTDTLSDAFSYTLQDAAGLTSSATLTLTLQGANDAPVAVNDTDVATEAGGVSNQSLGLNATGNVLSNDSDSDANDTKSLSAASIGTFTGNYGSLTLNTDGSYVYVIDNSNATVDALNTSTDTLSDTFAYTVTDAAGLTSSATLTLTLQGANDAPVAINDTGVGTEAGGISNQSLGANATGNVLSNDSDSDANDTKSLSAASIGTFTGNYGSLTLNTDGSYVYVIDNSKATVDALNTSTDTLSDTFAYTVTDTAGLTSSATLTLTLQGANDAPVAINDTGVAIEAGGVSNQSLGANATGNVLSNDTDTDANDIKTVTAGVFAGQFGSLTLNADGSYVYIIDNTNTTVNALNTNTETLSDTFTYTVTDFAGLTSSATLTLTLQGANDAPSLTAVNSVNYTALAIPTVLAPDLSLTDSDSSLLSSALIFLVSGWDLQDQLSFTSPTAAISGLYEPDTGRLTLSGDASLNDYQQALRSVSFSSSSTNPMSTLASRTVLWQITDSDQTLALSSELSSSSINIITANNAPLVITPTAITQQDTATYDRYSIITAALLATDADNNLLNYGLVNGILDGTRLSLTSAYGTLSIDSETGAYTYTPNGLTLNALGNEDSFTDNYLFTVSDGTTRTDAKLAINITGANDTPTGTVLITDDYGYALTTINSGTKLNNLSTSISDADGLGVFSYQWETSTDNSTWTAVEGGTLSSYTPTTKDENTQLHVKISYLDGNNYAETLTSNAVYIYTAYTTPTNTPPTFTGGSNTGLYLTSAGAAAVISAAVLTVLDYEQTPDALQYTLSALPTLGELSINGVLLNTYDSFTQADINNGLLNYQSYRNFSTIDNFTFDVSDGAGGVLSQQEFFIFSSLAAPVVIDLTDNGFNFIDITQSTINVDMNADGELDRTAWLAADDGLLAIDLNANQRIDQTHEFVFTQSAPAAPTDLAALQQLYDSNHDFLLTPDDAQWPAFGIWQDSNSNGLSDTNEFNSLTSWGVTEINLLSDGQQNTPAAGVFIEGMSNVIFADQHSSAAADASFAYQPSSQLTRLTIAQNTELSLKDQFTSETKPAAPSSLETLSITPESTATLDNEFIPQDATDSQAYFDDFAVPTHLS